jgi:hypothetical protein
MQSIALFLFFSDPHQPKTLFERELLCMGPKIAFVRLRSNATCGFLVARRLQVIGDHRL